MLCFNSPDWWDKSQMMMMVVMVMCFMFTHLSHIGYLGCLVLFLNCFVISVNLAGFSTKFCLDIWMVKLDFWISLECIPFIVNTRKKNRETLISINWNLMNRLRTCNPGFTLDLWATEKTTYPSCFSLTNGKDFSPAHYYPNDLSKYWKHLMYMCKRLAR